MKRYFALTLAFVLTAALFTGCGCTARDAQYTTIPTTLPTVMTTAPTETTHATTATRPTTEHTEEPNTTGTATQSTVETETYNGSRPLSPTVK